MSAWSFDPATDVNENGVEGFTGSWWFTAKTEYGSMNCLFTGGAFRSKAATDDVSLKELYGDKELTLDYENIITIFINGDAFYLTLDEFAADALREYIQNMSEVEGSNTLTEYEYTSENSNANTTVSNNVYKANISNIVPPVVGGKRKTLRRKSARKAKTLRKRASRRKI